MLDCVIPVIRVFLYLTLYQNSLIWGFMCKFVVKMYNFRSVSRWIFKTIQEREVNVFSVCDSSISLSLSCGMLSGCSYFCVCRKRRLKIRRQTLHWWLSARESSRSTRPLCFLPCCVQLSGMSDCHSEEASILWSHHEEARELPGQRNNARNNARCTQARKTTHGLDRQHQVVDRTLCGRVNQNDRG